MLTPTGKSPGPDFIASSAPMVGGDHALCELLAVAQKEAPELVGADRAGGLLRHAFDFHDRNLEIGSHRSSIGRFGSLNVVANFIRSPRCRETRPQ